MGATHSIDMAEWDLLYPATPSTIPTAAEFGQGKSIAFLMLNPKKMKMKQAMATDAGAANTGFSTPEGKWPGTSGEALREIARLKNELQAKEAQFVALYRDAKSGHIGELTSYLSK